MLAAALGALTQLATIDAEALRAIRREGALEASIAALKFFHVDAPIQRHGEYLLRLFVSGPQDLPPPLPRAIPPLFLISLCASSPQVSRLS